MVIKEYRLTCLTLTHSISLKITAVQLLVALKKSQRIRTGPMVHPPRFINARTSRYRSIVLTLPGAEGLYHCRLIFIISTVEIFPWQPGHCGSKMDFRVSFYGNKTFKAAEVPLTQCHALIFSIKSNNVFSLAEMPCVYPPEWPDYKRILGGIHEGVTADLQPPPQQS